MPKGKLLCSNDIKAANILLCNSSFRAKIADVGLAQAIVQGQDTPLAAEPQGYALLLAGMQSNHIASELPILHVW